MSSYAGRPLVLLGFAGWAMCVLYVVACLVAPSVFGDTVCELAPGSSVYGQASRSWLPPGTMCTYDLSDVGLPEVVTRPSPLRLVVLGGALARLPVLLYLRRLLTGRRFQVDA